jgi:hypothetical protein
MCRADISGGMIAVVQEKTGTSSSIPIHPELAAALKVGPTNGLNLIGAMSGRPNSGACTYGFHEAVHGGCWAATSLPASRFTERADAQARGKRRLDQADCRGLRP